MNTCTTSMSRRDAMRLLAVMPAVGPAWLRQPAPSPRSAPVALFDGTTLGHWRPVAFGGEGEVSVVNGAIRLGRGNDLTGIVWTGPLPGPSYRLSLEAMRIDGTDFFCALTFPVAGSHCSFVVGGWGGTLVGLSSLEGRDASENETGRGMRLHDKQWYRIAVEVTPTHLRAVIDDEVIADLPLEGREIGIRQEMSLCRPIGVASYRTIADLRRLQLES